MGRLMSSLVYLLRISVWYLTVGGVGLLRTRYIHKRIYNGELDVKTSLLFMSATVTESSPPETNSSSKLFESRLSEQFEASESISPIRSINLAFGLSSLLPSVCLCNSPCYPWSLLSSPNYPLIIITGHHRLISLFVFQSFRIPFSISSGCWPLMAPNPPTPVFSASARQGPCGR